MQLSNRMQIAILAIIAIVLAIIVVVQLWLRFAPTTPASASVANSITIAPEIADNLTELPRATAFSQGQDSNTVGDLETMIDNCDDYAPERRTQMEQHLEWLESPADIPPDVSIALGQNPTGRLIYGMASYTSIQWRIDERPADSCLIPIGRLLNDMLVAVGEQPLSIYDETTE